MKRKITAILLVVALVLSLGVVSAVPAGATDVSIVRVSGTGTECAGWTPTDPVSAPNSLDPANYSYGAWGNYAVAVSSVPGGWASLAGATWVSSAATTEGGIGDVWYLFKEEFTIPTGAVITSASLVTTADNAFSVYFGGNVIGTSGWVYGAAPSPQVPLVFASVYGPYSFSPSVGLNTLYFVVRNWVHTTYNPTGLLYKMEVEYEVPDIEKSFVDSTTYTTDVDDADLGDIVGVKLEIENPYGYDLTVQDVIPDGLKYIPGSYSGPGTPTVVDDTLTVSVGQGDHTITFDVQVVEVQCEDVDVVNWAYLYDGEEELDKDSADITLWPYEGFVKTFTIVHEDNLNGAIEVNELVMWDMNITVPNNVGWNIVDAVLKDNLGGELGMAGDGVNNDRANGSDEDDGVTAWSDVDGAYNTIPDGTLDIKAKGKTKKVQFKITDIDIGIGGSLDFVLGVFTDMNPSRWGQQSYTSTYVDHPLNSGATLKFTDTSEGGTGFLLSAHTCPVLIDVVPPIPLEL